VLNEGVFEEGDKVCLCSFLRSSDVLNEEVFEEGDLDLDLAINSRGVIMDLQLSLLLNWCI
jgi:hypothetical protein